jgi:AcrR family transcriptional regulator
VTTSNPSGGSGAPASRTAILDATQALMVEEGYASVSNRRVAARANLKPSLVQYHFSTMDELFLAVYRRAAEQSLERQAQILAGPQPLHGLWELMSESSRTGLAIEFMALARHRKSIRAEIARFAARANALQHQALVGILAAADAPVASCQPAGVAVLLAGAARALVMEEGLGIGAGHHEARAIVSEWLDTIEPLGR